MSNTRKIDLAKLTRVLARDMASLPGQVAAGSLTHQCPPGDGGLMPCCGLTPFEAPRTDRITEDPALVTCGKDPR